MKNKYQLLVNKWKNQADKLSNTQEQMWLYGCAADLELLIKQQSNQALKAISGGINKMKIKGLLIGKTVEIQVETEQQCFLIMKRLESWFSPHNNNECLRGKCSYKNECPFYE